MSDAPATIAVIGSGAAGLSAALAAAEAASSEARRLRVILIERARKGQHGGNTRWSPSYMRMAAPDRVAPGFEDDMQAASGGQADVVYFRRLREQAPAVVSWLQGHGVKFHKPIYYLSAGPQRIPSAAVAPFLRCSKPRCGLRVSKFVTRFAPSGCCSVPTAP